MMKRLTAILLFLAVFMSSNLVVMANACDFNEHFSMSWASSINTRAFSVQVRSSEFSEQISRSYAVNIWNNISPAINISTYMTGTESSGYTGNIILNKYALTGTTVGRTYYYRYNSGTGSYTEIFDFETSTALVNQVRISLSPLLLYVNDYNILNGTVAHEIGHALLLMHPDCGAVALMQSGDSASARYTIQNHDINCLVSKWG